MCGVKVLQPAQYDLSRPPSRMPPPKKGILVFVAHVMRGVFYGVVANQRQPRRGGRRVVATILCKAVVRRTIYPCIPTMTGPSTSDFHRPGRHCLGRNSHTSTQAKSPSGRPLSAKMFLTACHRYQYPSPFFFPGEEHQVGLLGAITPISSFFATPVLCAFADRHGIQQQVRRVSEPLYESSTIKLL